jgi:hypothetical protein
MAAPTYQPSSAFDVIAVVISIAVVIKDIASGRLIFIAITPV